MRLVATACARTQTRKGKTSLISMLWILKSSVPIQSRAVLGRLGWGHRNPDQKSWWHSSWERTGSGDLASHALLNWELSDLGPGDLSCSPKSSWVFQVSILFLFLWDVCGPQERGTHSEVLTVTHFSTSCHSATVWTPGQRVSSLNQSSCTH